MKKLILSALVALFAISASAQSGAERPRFPRFKVLCFYNPHVEEAHVQFAEEAVKYFKGLTIGDGFVFDVTTNMADMNDEKLKDYRMIMMLNDVPHDPEQRAAFERYMENGGGWFGFHVSAYNDRHTNWPWFVDFLGGGVFYRNNWPSMPAKLVVDKSDHRIAKGLPSTFIAPENEWYQWKPSPRENKDIDVIVSLSPDNYPLGLKDIIPDGDLPVVWTNRNYRMVYVNMGHDSRAFTNSTQNYMFINCLRWIMECDPEGNPFLR